LTVVHEVNGDLGGFGTLEFHESLFEVLHEKNADDVAETGEEVEDLRGGEEEVVEVGEEDDLGAGGGDRGVDGLVGFGGRGDGKGKGPRDLQVNLRSD